MSRCMTSTAQPLGAFREGWREPQHRLRHHCRVRRISRRHAGPAYRNGDQTFERVYPFGWLGVPPMCRLLARADLCGSARGFALCSMRSRRAAATTSSAARARMCGAGATRCSGDEFAGAA